MTLAEPALYSVKSGRFYAGDRRWTARRERASDFGTTFRALTFAEDNHLHGVEVVLASDKRGSGASANLERRDGPSLKFYGVRDG